MNNNDSNSKTVEPVFKEKIRLDIIYKVIILNWRTYIVPLLATVVISSLLVLCIPRYYKVNVMLAPEYTSGPSGLGGLGNLASMVGINMAQMSGSDAITPTFYPDLIRSTDFLVPLMYVNVTTEDSSFNGPFVDYITKVATAPFWTIAYNKVRQWVGPKRPSLSEDPGYRANPFKLNQTEKEIIDAISGSIKCDVDKKTDVISLEVTAQDPLVAALMADTVKQHLQDFMVAYRTNKARGDLAQITEACEQARDKYVEAQKTYAQFIDSHQSTTLESYRIVGEKYNNEAEMRHTAYNMMMQRKLFAETKVQEQTPVFTTLQNASVPVKHAGPKRMLIVAAFSLLVFVIHTIRLINSRKKA